MNNYLFNTITIEVLQNEIILSQGFSFESILRGIIGMIFLILLQQEITIQYWVVLQGDMPVQDSLQILQH